MKWIVIYLIFSLIISAALLYRDGPYKKSMTRFAKDGRGHGFFIFQGIAILAIAPILFLLGILIIKRRRKHEKKNK